MATSSFSAQLERVQVIQQSLKQVQLRWFVKQKGDVGGRLVVHISIIDRSAVPHKEWMYQRDARENVSDFFDVPSHLLLARYGYEINVKLMSRDQSSTDDDSNGLMQVLDTSPLSLRSVGYRYTMNEMAQLQDTAIKFVLKVGRWIPCGLFYRDKDEQYYSQCNGFIPLTTKNKNGDPASPTNGCIQGVFLGVNVDRMTGKLPEPSPYGDIRFSIPIQRLYGSEFNLYFADFYCHVASTSHHLTLVLTRANSTADNFCRSRLPMLNRMDNLFLYQDPITGRMLHTTAAWIHVFYTEMIPLGGGWFDWVHCNSTRPKTGKPKDPACPVCNI